MEPSRKRLCSGPQRLHEPYHPCSKEPPPGLGRGTLEIQETALGGLVCRSTPAAWTALGTSGRRGRLGEGRGNEDIARGGLLVSPVWSHMFLEAELILDQILVTSHPRASKEIIS